MSTIFIELRGSKESIEKLQGIRSGMSRALHRAMRTSVNTVLRSASINLTGRVLNVGAGKRRGIGLRQSLQPFVSDDGRTGRIGTRVYYGRLHEYGGTVRHPGGTAYLVNDVARVGAGRLTFVSNAKAAGFDLPRTRPHIIPIPERPWLRPALKDNILFIKQTFESELNALMKKDKDGKST